MKIWFITGASRGLGLETARAALDAGDRVVATGRHPQEIASALGARNGALLTLGLDVTNAASIAEAVKAALGRFGRIDVLVNNAGYGLFGAFEELSAAAIERQFATNVFGAFAVTRAILPTLRAQRSGHIITMGSVSGLIGYDQASIYGATKFALAGWSESLSLELARFGIHATVVNPGRFRTDFFDSSSVSYADLSIEDYAEASAAKKQACNAANHQQPGDPAALGRALVQLAHTAEPPVRFAVGSDAVEVVRQKVESLQTVTAQWHDLSVSTDFA